MLTLVTTDHDNDNDTSPTFADFWTLWPKRVARLDAEKAWKRLAASDQVLALVALVDWRSAWLVRGELQFVPHASTWLNGQRWTDELPEQWSVSHASHVAAKVTATTRTVMPQHVRDAIAKLKK